MDTIPPRSRLFTTTLSDWQTIIPRRVLAITHVFLVDPASAASKGVVRACIKIGTLRFTLAELSAESPCAELPEPFALDQEFTLYVPGRHCRPHDDLVVQVEGCYYRQGALSSQDGEAAVSVSSDDDDESDDEEEDCSDDEVEEAEEEVEHGSDDEEEEAEAVSSEDVDDSDDEDYEYNTDEEEEEESNGEVNGRAAIARSDGHSLMVQFRDFVRRRLFVGGTAPQFASAGSTAGFMRVAAVQGHGEGENYEEQISVLYRCTHFSAAPSGGLHVRGSMMWQLRFIGPPSGGKVRSLQLVGASLAPLVYPERFYKRLQRLWSRLIAEMSVPTPASRVEVLVDFGILRTADRTPERMEGMRAMLDGMLGKIFQPELHLEVCLPEPTHCGVEEDCSLCWELLEGDDLVLWPGCSKPHVFHGACVDRVLQNSDKCPLCRNSWYIEPGSLNIYEEKKSDDGARESRVGGKAKNVGQAVARTFFRILSVCS